MKYRILDAFINKYKVLLELKHTFEKCAFPAGTLHYRRVKHYTKSGEAVYYSYLRHQYRDRGRTVQIHVPGTKAADYIRMFQKRDALLTDIRRLERDMTALRKEVRRSFSGKGLDYYSGKVRREWEMQNRIRELAEGSEFRCRALDGTPVRSKNECIMANVLYKLGMAYTYEKELYLQTDNGKARFRPDFTVEFNGRELYIELFGQMEDENYCIDTMNKLEVYERNGIMEGKNFLGFYCNDSMKINSIVIEKALEQIKAGIMPREVPALS